MIRMWCQSTKSWRLPRKRWRKSASPNPNQVGSVYIINHLIAYIFLKSDSVQIPRSEPGGGGGFFFFAGNLLRFGSGVFFLTVFLIDPRFNLMPKKVIRPQMLWISYLLKWTEYCNDDTQYDFIRNLSIYVYFVWLFKTKVWMLLFEIWCQRKWFNLRCFRIRSVICWNWLSIAMPIHSMIL